MSFPTKKSKQDYDNNYLNYLMLQIKNADKISERNKNFDQVQQEIIQQEEQDLRPLEEQLIDETKQKNQAQKNAMKLFDKDTSRINQLMSYLNDNEAYIEFNQVYPQIYKELKQKNSFITVVQVTNMFEKIIHAMYKDVAKKDDQIDDDEEEDDEDDMYGNHIENFANDALNDYIDQEDDGTNWYDFMFGQGLKSKSKPTMTKREKQLHSTLNAILKSKKK